MEIQKLGPGLWYTLHVLSLQIVDQESYEKFRWFLDWLTTYILCSTCIDHMKTYLMENPVPEFNSNDTTESFYWTFVFHNNVNKRLGKPVIRLNDCYKLYNMEKCNNCF